MNGKPFLDTNILVYAVVDDPRRRAIAQELIAAGGLISVQVLNEFVSVARGKLRRNWQQIEETLVDFRAVLERPLPLTAATHDAAVALARDRGFSFYDALIVATAFAAGCSTLLTEDMADGMKIGGMTIRNPFSEN